MKRRAKPKARKRKPKAGRRPASAGSDRVKGHTRSPRGPDRGKPVVYVKGYRRRRK